MNNVIHVRPIEGCPPSLQERVKSICDAGCAKKPKFIAWIRHARKARYFCLSLCSQDLGTGVEELHEMSMDPTW